MPVAQPYDVLSVSEAGERRAPGVSDTATGVHGEPPASSKLSGCMKPGRIAAFASVAGAVFTIAAFASIEWTVDGEDPSIAAHLEKLPASEPHHICMVGDAADRIAHEWLLPQGRSLQEYKMPSKIAPENKCSMWEYAAGHSLISVSPKLEDRCAARFKVHSSSCDILVYASDTQDCRDLHKFRLIADQSFGQLIVLGSERDSLVKCYEERMAEQEKHGMPLDRKDVQPTHALDLNHLEAAKGSFRQAMLLRLKELRNHSLKHYNSDETLDVKGNFGDVSKVRERLLHGASSMDNHYNLMLEGMKHSQGLRSKFPEITEKLRRLADEAAPIVLDSGSGYIKAGFADEDKPKAHFPSAVSEDAVGDEAASKLSLDALTYAAPEGVVTDWDAMKRVWEYTVSTKLGTSLEERNILVTEEPLNPKATKEKTASVLFDDLKAKGIFLISTALLALIESGRVTGITIDIGHGVTFIAPSYEGYVMPHAVLRSEEHTGKKVTEYLVKKLSESGYTVTLQDADKIKETLLYARDYDTQLEDFDSSSAKSFTLADGTSISVGIEQISVVDDMLLEAGANDEAGAAVPEMTYNSIKKCDVEIRKELYANMVMAGGSSKFPGFDERVKREVQALESPTMKFKMFSRDGRPFTQWLGGGMYATGEKSKQTLLTKEEYAETGPSAVHRKFV